MKGRLLLADTADVLRAQAAQTAQVSGGALSLSRLGPGLMGLRAQRTRYLVQWCPMMLVGMPKRTAPFSILPLHLPSSSQTR